MVSSSLRIKSSTALQGLKTARKVLKNSILKPSHSTTLFTISNSDRCFNIVCVEGCKTGPVQTLP
ncbi:unnamed protein product [Arabis nemorensis]|uniref:Uncharacterized protein n=1 Tax=Arabis nemorensis TaxID=586526 RepID=A0A565BEL8_9BRAS|nr:unnamed protein product [Arabis nemorensis]